MIQERPQDVLAEVESGVAVESQSAEPVAVVNLLAVMPGTHHQENLVVICVLRLDRLVDSNGSVDVLLVPEAVDQHYRHLQRLSCQRLVHGLVAPERVVARMLENLPPE